MIRFEAVSKRYGPLPGTGAAALRRLDLRVHSGECVALVGPNGAGKSTIIGLALGFLRPSAGRVRVGGLAPRRYVRGHGAGYLPERFSPPGRLRAAEVLRRLALLDGMGAGEARATAREALDRTGLGASAGDRVRGLSRGNLQRLGVAQLLLRPRAVVLLDEPWGGLDPEGKSRLRALLADLRRSRPDAAMVVASHELGQVARVADRAVVLAGGRVSGRLALGPGTDGDVLERRILECGDADAPGRGRAERDGRRSPPRAEGAS